MKNPREFWQLTIIAVCAYILFARTTMAEAPVRYQQPQRIATLENEDVMESRGLAASHRIPGVFWTHNDSGDDSRIFSFDERGQNLGECIIKEAKATDWEDLASFQQGDQSWLVLCDVGDNAKRRKTVRLDFIHEPVPTAKSAKVKMTVKYRYSLGPHDCEAVAVDPHTNTILIVAKSVAPPHVFALPLPDDSPPEPLVAKSIGRISVPLVTGMDISHDGRRVVLSTYGNAYDFTKQPTVTWGTVFNGRGRPLESPELRQCEAICYGHNTYSLFLTSEGLPTPLWKLSPVP